MPSFTKFSDLEKYLTQNVSEVVRNSAELQRVLESAMRDAIMEKVYDAYEPEYYKRRGSNGGLLDTRNFQITSVDIVGNSVVLRYENLTTGADNLRGKYIIDLIEGGEGASGLHWSNPNGEWANKRQAIAHAKQQLRDNPNGLKNALKDALKGRGFQVK